MNHFVFDSVLSLKLVFKLRSHAKLYVCIGKEMNTNTILHNGLTC